MGNVVVPPSGRVWIYCPGRIVSGGPEALHQLARALMDSGVDARIVYYPDADGLCSVPDAYREYAPRVAVAAEDGSSDVVVVPEVHTARLRNVRRAKTVVWWLSIDNYLVERTPLRFLRGLMTGNAPLAITELKDVVHCAQSVYAVEYLHRYGISAALLTDYLRPVHSGSEGIASVVGRGMTVLYNPKKGYEFTRKLMRIVRADCKWVALEGMTAEQLATVMRGARIYVDFGPHPGRDRMPREAAVHGCCVLTGRRGSAANSADLPIPDWYKVDERQSGAVELVGTMIREILSDYPTHYGRFAGYRAWIGRQKTEFLDQVRSVFRCGICG